MIKALKVLLVLLALLVGLLVFLVPGKKINSDKPDVVVTTFALYDIARHLLQSDADVQMLIPFGRDVHTFEPTPHDMVRVEKSKLFLYSGAGLEPWASHFTSFGDAVDMSQYVKLRKAEHDHEDDDDGDHHHEHGAYDPHYWLDIGNMILLTEAREQLFEKSFPKLDKTELRKRAAAYIERLKTLDGLFKKRLTGCKLDTLVVGHDAFGYLAQRYGFHIASISGLSPDTMPDPKTMAALNRLVEEKGIKTVYYESFVSDKLVDALARETGVKVGVLQPLANITADEIGADYFRLMNADLLKLQEALECR